MNNKKLIVGKDAALKALLDSVKIVAPTNAHVLISGETGTGKELIAAAIHQQSLRADKGVINLNCAALTESLVESELFGYLKGAFTGADSDKEGIVAAADGGTLFLDEINSLNLAVQAKLLRFLESGEYAPVGGVKMHKADVRIIAASNIDLEKQVKLGKFRRDLYFRLNVVPLILPALRDRKTDIELLLKHYFSYFARKYRVKTPQISPETLMVLRQYSWPGNIRELRNLCENLTIQKLRRVVEPKDLPACISNAQACENASICILPVGGLRWEQLESALIRQAMEKCNGRYSLAAGLLGITRDSLYYRVKKYNLDFVSRKNLNLETSSTPLLRRA